MKVKDKFIKLYLINKLENYNHNTKIGEIEHDKLELGKNQTRLFVYLTVIGLIASLFGRYDFFTVLLTVVVFAEVIYIHLQDKFIKIHNDIIMHYQQRSVSEDYMERLLREIDQGWYVNWDDVYPIVTDSMLQENKKRRIESVKIYGRNLKNKISIKQISKNLENYFRQSKAIRFKAYLNTGGYSFIKTIKSEKLFGFLRKNIYLFTRISTAYDKTGSIQVYDFYPVKSYEYPKHGPPLWKRGLYAITVEIAKESGRYCLRIKDKEKVVK